MIDFKEEIAKEIAKVTGIEQSKLKENIEIPKEEKQGDYAFPCFRLAKILKKAPQTIAEDINSKIDKRLSRGISRKSGAGVNGVYNQDVFNKALLIEVGGVENTIEDVSNTLGVIAQSIFEVIGG